MAVRRCHYLPQWFFDFVGSQLFKTFVQPMKIVKCRIVFHCNNIHPKIVLYKRSSLPVVWHVSAHELQMVFTMLFQLEPPRFKMFLNQVKIPLE